MRGIPTRKTYDLLGFYRHLVGAKGLSSSTANLYRCVVRMALREAASTRVADVEAYARTTTRTWNDRAWALFAEFAQAQGLDVEALPRARRPS